MAKGAKRVLVPNWPLPSCTRETTKSDDFFSKGILLMKIGQMYLAVAVWVEKKFSEEVPSWWTDDSKAQVSTTGFHLTIKGKIHLENTSTVPIWIWARFPLTSRYNHKEQKLSIKFQRDKSPPWKVEKDASQIIGLPFQ